MFESVTKSYSETTYPRSRLEQMPTKRMKTMPMPTRMTTQRNRLTRSAHGRAFTRARCEVGGGTSQRRKLEANKLKVNDLETEEELRRARLNLAWPAARRSFPCCPTDAICEY